MVFPIAFRADLIAGLPKSRTLRFCALEYRERWNAGCGCPWGEIKEEAPAAGRRRGTFAPRASATGAHSLSGSAVSSFGRRPFSCAEACRRSEAHTYEHQSLMRISYASF